ncbi:MAG TPA: YfhO family protein [Longimicrobiales bacterium]|nr:YfhO family protein [Longimicrobiales bacterium]
MTAKAARSAGGRPTAGAPARTRGRGAEPERFPSWLAPALYALVTLILFREFVFGGAQLLGVDTQALSYFARKFYTDFVHSTGRFPLWDPMLYGGLPFVEGMHGDIFYPPSMSLFFLNAASAFGWKLLLTVFMAGVFAYIWLRELGVPRGVAFFGGLVYLMGADLVSLVFPGGDGKMFVTALAPLVFWLVERAFRRRRIADFAFLALGIALTVFTSHMQAAYFNVWGISLYAIFRAVQVGREEGAGRGARLFGLFALAGVLGVGAAAVQFFPPLGYLREYSQRSAKTNQARSPALAYQYSTQYSLHPEEIASLVVPDFVGDNAPTETRAGDTYWGRNLFKLNSEYAGFLPLLLAPLAFLRRRRAAAWFFGGLGTLALLYGLGADTPLFHLFYLIPGVKLFRAPSLIIFLYALSVVTLGALGLQRYLEWASGDEAEKRSARRYLWIAAAVMFVLALLAGGGALTGAWRAVFGGYLTPDKLQALAADAPNIQLGFMVAAGLAIATAGLWEALARGAIGRTTAVALVAFLAFMDLYRVDRPFIRGTELINATLDAQLLFTPTDGVRYLQQRRAAGEVFRAYDVSGMVGVRTPPNMLAIHGIEQLAGHHGNEIGRWRDLIGGDSPDYMVRSDFRLLDLTNTTYLLSPGPVQLPAGFEEAYRGADGQVVYRRTGALPRAFLVGQTQVVPDSLAVATLLSPGFDFRRTATLSAPLPAGIQLQPDPSGTVKWTAPGVNEYTLQVTSDRPALLVVSENYHEAWHAQLDGRAAPVLRVDYTFRGVPVPAGTHSVRLYYHSAVLQATAYVSVLLLLLLFGSGIGGVLLERRSVEEV